MNILDVTYITPNAHATLLCFKEHNNMESSTHVRFIANAQVLNIITIARSFLH